MKYMICYDNDSFYYTGEYHENIALNASLMKIEVETFETEDDMWKRYETLEKGVDKQSAPQYNKDSSRKGIKIK